MIFNIDKETMPREKIREIQLSRLQDLCRRVYANVPFYRRSFDEKGIKPADVQSLDDLKFLPFTLKQDMRNNYPYGLFAVPMEMIQRIHASSGTTGKATVVGYTKRDIEMWAECAARSLAAAGATANDIVQVSYGYGLFTGGFGLNVTNNSARPSSPCPAARPSAKSSLCATSARPCSAVRRPTPCISMTRASK